MCPHDRLMLRLFLFNMALLALVMLLIISCGGPSRTLPPGTPYPTTLGPQFKGGIIGINQTRCFGGGIGGCTLGGKAIGGPVGK